MVARRITPALLNKILILPNSFATRSTTRRQSAARVTSADSKEARPPVNEISFATAWPPDAFTSAITTVAFSRANKKAVARPIPEAPPVIIATLFASCIVSDSRARQQFLRRHKCRCDRSSRLHRPTRDTQTVQQFLQA